MKKKKFTSSYPNGIPGMVRKYKFSDIAKETEINTGLDFYGVGFVILPVHGAGSIVHLHLAIDSGLNEVISDPRNMISTKQNTEGKINIYRKENYGHVFIQNRSPFKQEIILYYFDV